MNLDNLDFLFLNYVSSGSLPVFVITFNREGFRGPDQPLPRRQVFDKVEYLQELGLVKINKKNMHFYLTKKGGAVWEEQFSPKWERYVGFELDFQSDFDLGVLRSMSYEKLSYIMEHGAKYYRFQEIKEIENWSPYYWKDGVSAYEVVCVLNGVGSSFNEFSQLVSSVRGPWVKEWVSRSYQDGIAWSDRGLNLDPV